MTPAVSNPVKSICLYFHFNLYLSFLCICLCVYLYLSVFVSVFVYVYLYRWQARLPLRAAGKKLIAPTLITPVQPYLLPASACRRVISTPEKAALSKQKFRPLWWEVTQPTGKACCQKLILAKTIFQVLIHGSWRCSSNQLHTQDQHLVLTTDGQAAYRQRSEMGVSES